MNKKLTYSMKAFTLIELLIVIAIIGLLSAIILASLNTSRTKGIDAAVKQNIDNARKQAELFYSFNNNQYVVIPSTPTAESATDVCSPSALVSNTKGVYGFIAAAQKELGANVLINGPINNATSKGYKKSGADSRITCRSNKKDDTNINPAGEDAWALEAPLKAAYAGITNPFYCVDSSGFAGVRDGSGIAAGEALCNN